MSGYYRCTNCRTGYYGDGCPNCGSRIGYREDVGFSRTEEKKMDIWYRVEYDPITRKVMFISPENST